MFFDAKTKEVAGVFINFHRHYAKKYNLKLIFELGSHGVYNFETRKWSGVQGKVSAKSNYKCGLILSIIS